MVEDELKLFYDQLSTLRLNTTPAPSQETVRQAKAFRMCKGRVWETDRRTAETRRKWVSTSFASEPCRFKFLRTSGRSKHTGEALGAVRYSTFDAYGCSPSGQRPSEVCPPLSTDRYLRLAGRPFKLPRQKAACAIVLT